MQCIEATFIHLEAALEAANTHIVDALIQWLAILVCYISRNFFYYYAIPLIYGALFSPTNIVGACGTTDCKFEVRFSSFFFPFSPNYA